VTPFCHLARCIGKNDFGVIRTYPLRETQRGASVIASLALRPGIAGLSTDTPRRADPPVALITLTVMLGMIMAIIDSSIVNVALSQMAGNLGASIDEISWVATGYILANVIVMPLNGWLTAVLGRQKYYLWSLGIFTIASLLCGTSHTVQELVIWRIVQGLGGGALQPTAQAILFESYPANKRGQAMAIFGIGAMVGPAIGPTLGGYIVDNYAWPLIFFINLPIGIVAFMMTLAYIRNPSYIVKPSRGIDITGLSAMAIGIASLQYVLERGQREDWFSSGSIVILSIVSVAALTFFIVRELRDPHPFVDLSVFRSRSFTAGSIIAVVSGFGLFGLNLVLPLFFQNVLGFSAWQTGVALLPGAVATALSMPIAGRLTTIIDGRISIAVGLAMFGAGSWAMGGLTASAGFWDIFWPRAWQGFALGFLFVPLTTVTLSAISNAKMANATGLYTLVRQLGGSLGIAILELLQTRRQDFAQQTLASGVTLANPAVSSMLNGAANRTQALIALAGSVEQNAIVLSYDYVFRICAIVFVLSIPLVFMLSSTRKSNAAAAAAALD
jgi:MFS transporter, DHA2 family, multidrug resistance protein